MKTSDGCTVTGTRQVINHEVPQAAFTWANACYDGTADVSFTGANLNGNLSAAEIQSYTWDFAATSPTPVLTYSGSTGGKNPMQQPYTNIGRDSVQLIVTSIHNCRDTRTATDLHRAFDTSDYRNEFLRSRLQHRDRADGLPEEQILHGNMEHLLP